MGEQLVILVVRALDKLERGLQMVIKEQGMSDY